MSGNAMTPRELHAKLGKLIEENPRAKLRWDPCPPIDIELCIIVDVELKRPDDTKLQPRIVLNTCIDS